MHLGNDIRSIWSTYNVGSLLTESTSQGHLEDIGVKIVKCEMDGHDTWQIHQLDSTDTDRPLDWEYVGINESVEAKAAQVRNTYKTTGRPTFN